MKAVKTVKANNTKRHGVVHSRPKRMTPEFLNSTTTLDGDLAVDSVLTAKLTAMLEPLDEEFVNACLKQKLLPRHMEKFLSAARFVSPLLIPARLAQIWTGVPASIMLAEVWFLGPYAIGSHEVPNPLNDYFDTGGPFSSIETSFLDHANSLTRDHRFQAVMEAKDDPAEYLKQVGLCKCWDDRGRRDRVEFIASHGFLEYDGFEVG